MSDFADRYLHGKKVRACFHEAGHIQIALAEAPGSNINAYADARGGGQANVIFPEGTPRHVKLLAAVAGLLAEAKGSSGKLLNADRDYVRMIAVDLDRRLREGETVIATTIEMADGDQVPSTINSDDFSAYFADIRDRSLTFKEFLAANLRANEIEEAMRECIERFENESFWESVTLVANRLLEHGWFSTED